MRELDCTSFNSVLYDKLVELRRVVENNITPENVNFFNPLLIEKATGFLNKNYEFDNFSNINSVDTYKLNSMINHLIVNKFEYQQIYKEIDIDSDDYTAVIDIPSGFDGRNSFVGVVIDRLGISTTQLLIGSFPHIAFDTAVSGKTISGKSDYNFTCYLVRNKNNIKVVTKDIKTVYQGYNTKVIVFGFMWRRK